MIFVLRTPPHISGALQALWVPGRRDPSDHVTVLYFGDDPQGDEPGTVPVEVQKALEVAYKVAKQHRPFRCSTDTVDSFPGNDDGVPIKAPIVSPPLVAFQAALREACDEAGLDYDRKYPRYQPHCTLSYASPEEVPGGSLEPLPIPPLTWWCTDFELWWGRDGAEMTVRVPLGASTLDRMAAYVADKFLRGNP